jgi:hypothetical protein
MITPNALWKMPGQQVLNTQPQGFSTSVPDPDQEEESVNELESQKQLE